MSNQDIAILLVQEGNSPKTQWPLAGGGTMIVGRDASSDVQIDDRQVSRRHAEINRTPEGYTIRDLGSKNGTFLNGEVVSDEPRLMRNGDEIGIALCAKLTFIEDEATVPVMPVQQKSALKMDLSAKRVWISGQEVMPPLSVAQYTLLELLYKNAGNVVSRDTVVETVWSVEEAEGVSEQAIDALARRLRERIAEIDPESRLFETVRGYGFRLNL